MKLKLEVEVELQEGKEQPSDYVLDALCGSLGRQNAAPQPFTFTVSDDELGESVYVVELVDGTV